MLRIFNKILALFLLATIMATAQETPYSERMAATFLSLYPDSIAVKEGKPAAWDYEQGLMLKALERVWYRTGDGKYFRYIQHNIDHFVNENGEIKTYKYDDFNLDNLATGRALLTLYAETGKEKYKKAAFLLQKQLENQPRTKEGGYWHKQKYPYQMWLDGLFMAEPFHAEFSQTFKQSKNFDDIANQFIWMEKHARDTKTGLLFHGWDESKQQKWANSTTGCSPNFWGRALGWYAVSLLEVLDYFPKDNPKRAELLAIYKRLMPVLVKYQDPSSGCWWQVLDKAHQKGNYLEASASCMFVYALAKGVRMEFLDKSYFHNAKQGYEGILKNFVERDERGMLNLNKTVSVGGLGGTPYRDGSYEYYLSEPIKKNDLKGVGPFIMASIEMETAKEQVIGKNKIVGLDYFFNHEFRKNTEGEQERFHYTWEDRRDSGYSLWGQIFSDYGAKTTSLPEAPSLQSLKGTDVYIIVDPDTPKETSKPNYIEQPHIKAIYDWVKAGGVLVLLANDTANCEIKHFNELTKAFGIEFTGKNRNFVKNDQFEQGKFLLYNNPIFKDTQKIYIKEIVTLSVKPPAESALTESNDVIMATAKVGKGTVFVLGDPWIYNEYLNGKRLPFEYQNYKAAKYFTAWLLNQIPSKNN